MKKTYLGALALCLAGGVAYAANPVLVDSGGSGNFTSVQAAISSFCAGGSNAAETPPFIINVKAGSGPYDEAITLEDQVIGKGNIVGSIEIKSDTPGVPVIFKVQPTPGAVLGTDDGLMICQSVHNVTFRDIVFTRSLTVVPTDEIVRADEFAANNTMNTLAFYNCVFTEPTTTGDPMVTSKAGALAGPPPARGGGALSASPRLLQIWGDPGESVSVILNNCVFYGSTNMNCIVRLEGTLGTGVGNGNPEVLTITDSISAYAFADCYNIGGQNQAAVINVNGTNQKAGPMSATVAWVPAHKGGTANNGHSFTLSSSGNALLDDTTKFNFNGIIAYAPADGSTNDGFSSTAARGISGGSGWQRVENALMLVPALAVVDITRMPTIWDKVTIVNTTNAYYGGSATVYPSATLTITNSILAGTGTKISGLGLPAGGTFLTNSAVPLSGPDAATAVGAGVTETNVINDDPGFASKDGLTGAFLDVQTYAYAAAGVAGAPLAGGADYIGAASGVNDWTLY